MQKFVKLYAFGRQIQRTPYIPHSPSYIIVRFHYVNSGSAVIYYAKKEHELTAGNFYLLPPCTDFHTIQANDYDHSFFDFKTSYMLKPDSFTEIPDKKYNINHFFKFYNDALCDNQFSIETAQQLCTFFLSHLEQNIQLPYLSDTHIQKAIEIILNSPSVLSAKTIADKLNLNEDYFIRIFTKTMGVSPMKYIRSSMLSEGIHMLKKGMSVTSVAECCGYSSSNAFWKAFRKEFGFSPSQIKAPMKTERTESALTSDNNRYREIHIFSPADIKTPKKR